MTSFLAITSCFWLQRKVRLSQYIPNRYRGLEDMRTFTLDQQRKNRKTVYKLYELQPTGPARRLATQQVGYD